jgi:hypothetical protein
MEQATPYLLVSFLCKQYSFLVLHLSHYVLWVGGVTSLNAPSIAPKYYRVFPSARKLWCALQRKHKCYIRSIQAWVIVLLTMSSVLMKQQCIFSTVSLGRNKYM